MERREERGRGEGVCVSVAIWPRSAPRMSTAIERGTNTMAPRGWEPLPCCRVRGRHYVPWRGSSLIAADPAPWQLWILIMSQLVSAHLENLFF